MGSCYSKKARGGLSQEFTISAPMASTAQDASRLARATPYARSNTNANSNARTPPCIPKNPHNDNKTTPKNSNIPRFSSSLPIPSERKTVVNDNEVIHVVNNNNADVGTRSVSTPRMPKMNEVKPKSVGSKSCPDKISEGGKFARTPTRGSSGITPRQFGKSSPGLTSADSKLQTTRVSMRKNNTNDNSPCSKSPSRKGFESRDSLSDFDSGIGNSLTDKAAKPEDSDTVKDLEQIEFNEEFSPNLNIDACPVRAHSSTPKSPRAPTYKREPNGKWSFDEQHFGIMGSPKEKHSFKMNASEDIFSTYASYKGLLSYQKKSLKPIDASKFNTREKIVSSPDKQPNSNTGIPKVRRQGSLPLRSSVFYVDNSHGDSTSSGSQELKQQQTPDSSDDSNGVLSPPSDCGREFLIDDEISDQPGLTFGQEDSVQSLQQAVSELQALQLSSSSVKKRTDSVSSYSSRRSRLADQRDSLVLSELGSSCSSIGSDDLMMDFEKTFEGFPEGTANEGLASPMRKLSETPSDKVAPLKVEKKFDLDDKKKRLHRRLSNPQLSPSEREWRHRTVSLPLRPPRQMTVSEEDDGCLRLDSSSYRLLCQDLNGVKTMLFRLKTVIQEAETINPFDQGNPNNIFYQSLVQNDFPSSLSASISSISENGVPDLPNTFQENADLRRQVVLLQQQSEEKDHTIHLLQQQMTKYLNVEGTCTHDSNKSNAATQTERSRSLASSLTSSSGDDSMETLVSCQDDFEKSFRKKSEEQDVLKDHLIEVARLLDLKPRTDSPNHSEC